MSLKAIVLNTYTTPSMQNTGGQQMGKTPFPPLRNV